MILGSEQYVSSIDFSTLPQLTLNGTQLEYCSVAKNLGVLFTPTLNWEPQVNLILQKVYSALSSLKFHRNSLNFSLRKQLVQSLVMPYFDYASIVFLDLNNSQQSSLQTAHNASIRFMYGNIPFIPSHDISTRLTHRRLELGWLSLNSRRHLQLACLMFSVVSHKQPSYLYSSLKLRNSTQLSTRPVRTAPRMFEYKSPRTEAWARSFFIAGQELLNKLGITVYDAHRTKQFKTWLYKLLLHLETQSWKTIATINTYHPLETIDLLPGNQHTIDLSAFCFTNQHLLTPNQSLSLSFISEHPVFIRSHL